MVAKPDVRAEELGALNPEASKPLVSVLCGDRYLVAKPDVRAEELGALNLNPTAGKRLNFSPAFVQVCGGQAGHADREAERGRRRGHEP